MRIAVLVSGQGTNLEAICRAIDAGDVDAEISVVVSNRPAAPALERARRRGIRAVVLEGRGMDRESYDRRLAELLKGEGAELIVLAGFMRLLSPLFVRLFPQRIVNIHPSLLPAFPGVDAVRQALDHGVKVTGCTVHFVDEGLDSGPIIAQQAVDVLEDDTLDSLQERIHTAEHRLYPLAIGLICRHKVKIRGRRCVIDE